MKCMPRSCTNNCSNIIGGLEAWAEPHHPSICGGYRMAVMRGCPAGTGVLGSPSIPQQSHEGFRIGSCLDLRLCCWCCGAFSVLQLQPALSIGTAVHLQVLQQRSWLACWIAWQPAPQISAGTGTGICESAVQLPSMDLLPSS